jgi:serine/threonine protein phosphatase PrpC
MEDAHITALDVTDDISVLGVFDGHGGKGDWCNI